MLNVAFALQHTMQVQPVTQKAFLKLRREYVQNVARVSKRRQQLLDQLQSTQLQLLGIDSRETGSRLSVLDEMCNSGG